MFAKATRCATYKKAGTDDTSNQERIQKKQFPYQIGRKPTDRLC